MISGSMSNDTKFFIYDTFHVIGGVDPNAGDIC